MAHVRTFLTAHRTARIWLLASCSLLIAGPAHPQESAPLTEAELRAALRERDELILELLGRVEELERRQGITPEQTPPEEVAPPGRAAAPEPPPAAGAPAAGPEEGETTASAPGQFEVDEEAAERALEQTLVQTGALLLPAGYAEFEPSFSYTRRVNDLPFIVANGTIVPGESSVRRNEFDFSLGLRVGLPFDSQLELDLPYTLVDQSVVFRDGANVAEVEETGNGLGDISVGLAKTLLREEQWWPDVVARVTWDSGSGKNIDNGVGLGNGFDQILGQVSVTKRQDPLAFVGAAGYRYTFEDDNLKPGGELLFSLGAVLAASPDTSLRVSLSQQFASETEFEGQDLAGTDQVASTLNIGATSVLDRGLFIDGAVAVGLTDDAPDYAFILSLPIQFGVPGF